MKPVLAFAATLLCEGSMLAWIAGMAMRPSRSDILDAMLSRRLAPKNDDSVKLSGRLGISTARARPVGLSSLESSATSIRGLAGQCAERQCALDDHGSD